MAVLVLLKLANTLSSTGPGLVQLPAEILCQIRVTRLWNVERLGREVVPKSGY